MINSVPQGGLQRGLVSARLTRVRSEQMGLRAPINYLINVCQSEIMEWIKEGEDSDTLKRLMQNSIPYIVIKMNKEQMSVDVVGETMGRECFLKRRVATL